jgi:hypothetical protein
LRFGLHRIQLYNWRREFRSAAVADAGIPLPEFVPVVAGSGAGCALTAIEIEIGGAIVRVGPSVEFASLGGVLRLLKARA